MLLFIGFVVVVCVISEAAGKAADRQKGKAVVRQTNRQTDSLNGRLLGTVRQEEI